MLAQLFDKSLLDLQNSQVILLLTLYLLNIEHTVLLDLISKLSRLTDCWMDGRTDGMMDGLKKRKERKE